MRRETDVEIMEHINNVALAEAAVKASKTETRPPDCQEEVGGGSELLALI